MTITLVRHAKVVINQRKKITAIEMKAWIEEYNHAFVSHEVPNEIVVNNLKYADVVLSSALSRTIDSLKFIGVTPREENKLFDEIELPVLDFKNSSIKLYPKMWLKIFRFMQVLPIVDKRSKILRESKLRSKMASLYLDKLAHESGNVSLMGHGGMNWLIGKELKKSGWKCIENVQSTKNWGYKIYEKGS
jgi:broad specificity phosphatase PhoE